MKKVVFLFLMLIFVIGILVSCNKSVCPAYVQDDNTEQADSNG
jgi:hypothetical protein